MKTIFSDKTIAFLRKIPTPVWFFVLAATCFFEQCHDVIYQTKAVAETFNAAFAEQGLEISVNSTALTVFSCILEGIIEAAIIELLFYIAYSILARRFYCAVNKKDFSFRLRILFIIANLILGIINLTAFFAPNVSTILSACTGYAVPAVLLALFYEDFRKRFVPKRNHAKMFGFIACIYVGIAMIWRVVNAVEYTVLTEAARSTIGLVAVWVDFGIVLLSAVGAYLNYRRLDKIAKEPEDNDLFIEKEPEKNTIFKDLGF